MNTPLIAINIILTIIVLYVVSRRSPAAKVPQGAFAPIKHPRVEGPTTASPTRGVSYWRPKADPKAEPFLAAWYEKDTTLGTGIADLGADEVIPADTYVDLTGRKVPGAKFRTYYEPAEEVMVVSKVKPKTKLQSSTLVTANADAPQLSPEEEEKLAEEYELGGQVSERR